MSRHVPSGYLVRDRDDPYNPGTGIGHILRPLTGLSNAKDDAGDRSGNGGKPQVIVKIEDGGEEIVSEFTDGEEQ
jgi:hypothetical protein